MKTKVPRRYTKHLTAAAGWLLVLLFIGFFAVYFIVAGNWE